MNTLELTKHKERLLQEMKGSSNNNISAIDWLVQELELEAYPFIIKQAKQMQKEQHSNTWSDSRTEYKGDDYIGKEKSFEEYYNETYNTQMNEAEGREFMSGMEYIPDLSQEVEDRISQLKKKFPLHKFTLTSNSSWRSDDPSLEGTYTLSYSGPEDEMLRKMIRNIDFIDNREKY